MLDNVNEMSDDKVKIEDQTQTLDSVTQRIAQTETFLEDITSKVSMLEVDVSNVRGMLLDDENKIENQTQTLDSVTQRVSQTETFLEDKVSKLKFDIRTVRGWFMDHAYKIETQTLTLDAVTQRVAQTETFVEETTSKVSSLEFDVSNVRGMLLDDENKIEIQTQTLESVTQRLSRTETVLEDMTSKASMLEYDVSVFRKTLLDDENKVDNQAQTLNSVTQRLLQCEANIRTIHSSYVSFEQMYKTSVSSNDLLERRLQEQNTSNSKECRELANSRDLHEQEIQSLKKRIEELEMSVQTRDSKQEKPSVQTLPHAKSIGSMLPLEPVRQTGNVAVCSTLMFAARKGTNRIYVYHENFFHKGQTIIIGERFVAKIIDYGSLVLDRNLDQDFPHDTRVRTITPQDVRGVGGQNTQPTQNNQRITNQIGDRSTATDQRTENANVTNTLSHATTPQARSVGGQDIQSTNRIPNSQRISDQISDRSNAPGLLTQNTDVRNTPLNNWWPPAPQPTRPMGHQSTIPTVNDAVWSTLAMTALQGTNRIYVYDQQLFHKGQMIIIHELFVAQIIDFGSLVLDRNLDQTFPAGAIVRAITPQETRNVDSQNRQSTHGIPTDNQGISNQNGDRSRILPDPPVENTSEIDTETSPLKAWLLRGMNKHGKAHWADRREYYNEYQPTVAELDKSFRPPKPEQMRLALSIITSLPGQLEDLVRAVNEIRSFERTFIRVMKGLTPACVLYAKLLLNGVKKRLHRDKPKSSSTKQEKKKNSILNWKVML